MVSAGTRQFIRFLVSGGLAAMANFGSRFIFSQWFNLTVSVVLAFLVGLVVGFVLMRQFVFHGRSSAVMPQILRYIAVNLFALMQTLVITLVLARWVLPGIGVQSGIDAIAHLAGVLVPVASSFFLHKIATFR